VYVLTPGRVNIDNQINSPGVFSALSSSGNLRLFIFYLVLTLAVLAFALWLKSTRPFQRIGRFINRASGFAPDIIRVAFGASLIFSAANNALFGPELPIDSFPLPDLLRTGLLVAGVGLTLGIFTGYFAWAAVLLFVFGLLDKGTYMLTYVNYLGEAIAIILLPRQRFSVDRLIRKIKTAKSKAKTLRLEKYSMPVARILFGLSLLYTAIDVKFLGSALSLNVVQRYNLTDYFPYDPLFIVLGAGLIESLIALLYIFGVLQRFNTVFFLIFLVLSLTFFNESVWPHYLLIALAVGIFLHKPDIWAADRYLFPEKLKSKK